MLPVRSLSRKPALFSGGILMALVAAGFTPVRCLAAETPLQLKDVRREWAAPVGGLQAKVSLEKAKCPPKGPVNLKLFLKAEKPGTKHPKLLQGSFVFTFVPIGHVIGSGAFSTHKTFSGAGGVDYSGKTGMAYSIPAPSAPRKYYLYATVLSTQSDINSFLIHAKVAGNAGPWWTGALATPPMEIQVAADDDKPTAGAWSPPVEGLRSRVVLDRDSHKVGQSTRIRLQLENASKKPISYAACHIMQKGHQDTLSLSVWEVGAEGKALLIRLRDLYPNRRIGVGPGKNSWRTLKPGEMTETDMSHTFYYGADILPRPGRYRIAGVYISTFRGKDGAAWTGMLQSPPVELSITAPDPLGDRASVEKTLRGLLLKEKGRLPKGDISRFLYHCLWPKYEGRAERLLQRLVNQLTNPEAERPAELTAGLGRASKHSLAETRAFASYCKQRLVRLRTDARWQKAVNAHLLADLEKRISSGTALSTGVAQYYRERNWGQQYAQQMARLWKARPALGVSLQLRPLPGRRYAVGGLFDCKATVTNGGTEARELVVGGSCGMTHPLGIAVITPEGGLGVGWCRGAVGGPHCKCARSKQNVRPGQTVDLQTGFASAAAVPWRIAKPGRYVVIGVYGVPHGDKNSKYAYAYSAPLVIDVPEKKSR